MKYEFEKLLNRSYEAIKSRGLIKSDTHIYQFMAKIEEEYNEAVDASDELYLMNTHKAKQHYVEELTDLATVCMMQIMHLGANPIKEFEKVVLKNEQRAEETTKKLEG